MQLIDMDTMWQCETCFHHKCYGCDTWCDAGEAYRPAANKLKVIDPASLRPKGEWEINELGYLVCTHCAWVRYGIPLVEHFNFCPNCGADMRGESDG